MEHIITADMEFNGGICECEVSVLRNASDVEYTASFAGDVNIALFDGDSRRTVIRADDRKILRLDIGFYVTVLCRDERAAME